jgi:predicted transcriptional regulator
MGAKADKAQKHAPWVAIVIALGVPTLGYLEARSLARAATTKASKAQNVATERTGKVEDTQGAVYKLLADGLGRVAEDTDACHERVDALAEAVQTLAKESNRGRRGQRVSATYSEVSSEMVQQAAIVRPMAKALPKRKADVKKGDPIAGALAK